MSTTETYRNGVLTYRADDASRRVTRWDDVGVLIPSTPQAPNPRDYTAAENTDADQRAARDAVTSTTATILQQLADGVATIQAVRAAANSDIATADAGQTQALAVKGQAATKRTQVAAFVPSATYKASDLTAIRDVLLDILDRQALYAQTFADDFAWRKAVDQNALTTDDALIGLARIQSGRITG